MMDENHSDENALYLGPIRRNPFGESYFFNLCRYSFDKVGASALFEAKFADTLFSEDTLNIVVGSDSGLLPQYIQGKKLPKGTRYLFIEPEGVLRELKAHGMLNDLDERILCIDMRDWDDALLKFKLTDYFYINAVRSFNAICAADDFINEYAELSWHITEVLSQLHWKNSAELGMEAFIMRQINNVVDNRLPAKLLQNAFKGETAVLLAGGPSLDAALEWVKLHRNQLVVFAVSRISRQLLAAGFEPDFVFSVDPTELSFDISKEMLNFSDKVTFVCSHHTVPTLISQWLGRVLYLGARLPWDSNLNVANLSSAGPTVTNTALNVAHDFGFKRIILAGVDLCFTREGFTHAKGSDEQLAGPRFNLTSLQVETNAGYLAPTSCDFAQAIVSLGYQAQFLGKAGCEIVTVSDSAAKIDAIRFIPQDQIELSSGLSNVSDLVTDKLAVSAQNATIYYQKVADDLNRARFQINAIANWSKTARQINDDMYNAVGVVANFKDKKKLDQIEKKFKREYRHFSKLVKRFGIRSFIKLAKPFSDEEWTAEEAKQLGDVYYQAYEEGANKLLKLIDGALDRLNARKMERSGSPDWALLMAQAEKDGSFGRVRLWRKIFAAEVVTSNVAETLDEFEQRFLAIIAEKNTRHFARAKSHSQLANVRQRAGLLFKHKKMQELNDLSVALDNHENQGEAEVYRYLIQGYLAELSDKAQTALEYYQRVVDAGNHLLEEALGRIAAISIDQENIQLADLSLHCLSQLNPAYLPFYADMQRLHGDMMVAIDAYGSYISQFPQDTATQMKLTMLYLERNLYDAAEIMLDYILQNQPDMPSALALKQHLHSLKSKSVN